MVALQVGCEEIWKVDSRDKPVLKYSTCVEALEALKKHDESMIAAKEHDKSSEFSSAIRDVPLHLPLAGVCGTESCVIS